MTASYVNTQLNTRVLNTQLNILVLNTLVLASTEARARGSQLRSRRPWLHWLAVLYQHPHVLLHARLHAFHVAVLQNTVRLHDVVQGSVSPSTISRA